MSLLPFPENRDMVWDYLPELNRPLFRFYYLLLGLSLAGSIAVFTYRIPVSVPVSGLVKPALERTELHAAIPGVIEAVFKSEGDTVQRGELIVLLRDVAGTEELQSNEKEMAKRLAMVGDLGILTGADKLTPRVLQSLQTPLYQQQAAAFLAREAGEQLNLSAARHEAGLGRQLAKDKVISAKELYDQEMKESKMQLSVLALQRAQWASWQTDLVSQQQALLECRNRKNELLSRASQREIRAPAAGVIAGIRSWYAGSVVRPEDPLCRISPEGNLVGECYVATRTAGLLHPGQPVRIRIDGFGQGLFGLLSARIISVSNDIQVVENKPLFLVRCLFRDDAKTANRPYRGLLRKGLSFQGNCLIGERTLFQLMYERVEDWLKPDLSASYPS